MILDGKALSQKIKDELKFEIENLVKETGKTPKLAVVIVGDNPASQLYVKNKKNACKYVGIESVSVELPANITQAELEAKLTSLNNDETINGILLQLPLPKGFDERSALNCIDPIKDVDGLSSVNLGKLLTKEWCLTACTPTGVMELLKEYNIELEGKHAVIINRSLLVGKPLEQLLLAANATVTVCHSHSGDITPYTKKADVIVTAVGKRNFLTKDMIKKGVVIVDVAIVRDEQGLCGDCDYENMKDKCSYISPVPGGAGPLTIAMLLKNTIKTFKKQNNI